MKVAYLIINWNFKEVARKIQMDPERGFYDVTAKYLNNYLHKGEMPPDEIAGAILNIAGIGISLDGLEPTHDYIRNRKGLFQKVFRGINRIHKADIPLTIITTATRRNIHELPLLSERLIDAGVKQWQVQPIFPLGRAQNSADLQLDDVTYLQLGAFVRKYGPKLAEAGLELQPGNSFGYFTSSDTREPPWRGCPAGLFSCGITSDGKVKGCLSMPDELIEGDLRENDLWDIWFHPDSFTYTRNYSPQKLGAFCQSCDKQDQCRGGCISMSYGSTGCFHNDPYCFYRMEREGIEKGLQTEIEMSA